MSLLLVNNALFFRKLIEGRYTNNDNTSGVGRRLLDLSFDLTVRWTRDTTIVQCKQTHFMQ